MDILKRILRDMENPSQFEKRMASHVRRFSGADCVVYLHPANSPGMGVHIEDVVPHDRRQWAESSTAHKFYSKIRNISSATIWNADVLPDYSVFLHSEGFESVVIMPIRFGSFCIGTLLLFGLPDETLTNSFLQMLDMLSTIIALVLHNASLYKEQEMIINKRTADLQIANEHLETELIIRKRAQKALKANEEQLRLATEASNVGLWDWNLITNEVYFSPIWKSLLGYEENEISNSFDSLQKVVHPDDYDSTLIKIKASIDNAEIPYVQESRFRHKDGSYRWILSRASCLLDEEGKPWRLLGSHVDITERKQLEEFLTRRILALTQPLDDTGDIAFTDLFNLEEIQTLQDLFAQATGVASLITYPDGKPITRPSQFCHLCAGIIRKTKKGLTNCMYSDAIIGRHHPEGPVIQKCLSGGLWDAGASITVGGRHIANWLVGQVRNEAQEDSEMLKYAHEIGADENAFMEAYRQVPAMPEEQFRHIAQALFTIAGYLSMGAYRNIQQARFITEHKKAEEALAIAAERNRHIADVLQNALVPASIPVQLDGYEITTSYHPALIEAEVCGDFYDLFDIGEGKIGIVIGDVVGKGLSAAVRVAAIRHTIRSYAFLYENPSQIMTLTCNALYKDIASENDMFTVFLAVLDTRNGMLAYTNAGHEPPLIMHRDGSVEFLVEGGCMFAGIGPYEYKEESIYLQENDVFVMFTDGITEARTVGQEGFYGPDRVVKCLSENLNASSEQIASRLMEDAISFASGKLRDDAAIIVIRKKL